MQDRKILFPKEICIETVSSDLLAHNLI